MTKTGLVLSKQFSYHKAPPNHPECPERIAYIYQAFNRDHLLDSCHIIETEEASWEQILTNHSQAYLDRLKIGETYAEDPSITIEANSIQIAKRAAGSAIKAVDLVEDGTLDHAFCILRPPGHHAERDFAMGFCIFNNIAIAAHHLTTKKKRVLILDWDVHHGNGTQHSFYDRADVMFCSFHGDPNTLFPGTGFEDETGINEGKGTTLNIPMAPGSDDDAYREAFFEVFLPHAEAFSPDFILISAGFDAHKLDPLGNVCLETESFAWLTKEVRALADRQCDGKIVSLLEGGYHPRALADSAAVHLKSLLE